MKKSEESLMDLWDIMRQNNIHIMEIPEEGQKGQSVF